MSTVTLLAGDVIDVLKTLPDKSVHSCICSPPFFGLRDYGTATWEGGQSDCEHTISRKDQDGMAASKISSRVTRGKRDVCLYCGAIRIDKQIGLEESPELYVARLVEVFREVRRVLRDDGTLWLNLSSSYWAGKGQNGSSKARRTAKQRGYQQAAGTVQVETKVTDGRHPIYKPKDMIPIPWLVAIALQADGWWLRADIIWQKPNTMPASFKDRPTPSHEYIFLLSKGKKYFYDHEAIKEPLSENTKERYAYGFGSPDKKGALVETGKWHTGSNGRNNLSGDMKLSASGRNKRSVWTIATKPYKGAHFAVWPEALVEPMLLASTSAKGCCPACGAPWRRITKKGKPIQQHWSPGTQKKIVAANGEHGKSSVDNTGFVTPQITVGWKPTCQCPGDLEPIPCTAIDIFMGSGTTGAVCVRHGRDFIGIDLNPSYLTLAEERIAKVQLLLFLEEA